MKKLAERVTIEDNVSTLRREMAKVKRESNVKARKLELQVKSKEEDIQKKRTEIERLKTQLGKKTKDLSQLKKENSFKIKGFELKVQRMMKVGREDDLLVSKKSLKEKNQELSKTKDEFARLKRVSSMKTETLELKVEEMTEQLGKRDNEVQTTKELLDRKNVDLHRLREELKYKNTQLASKDLEMESYKKVTDEKIFQLDAKVKELEGKRAESSFQKDQS